MILWSTVESYSPIAPSSSTYIFVTSFFLRFGGEVLHLGICAPPVSSAVSMQDTFHFQHNIMSSNILPCLIPDSSSLDKSCTRLRFLRAPPFPGGSCFTGPIRNQIIEKLIMIVHILTNCDVLFTLQQLPAQIYH